MQAPDGEFRRHWRALAATTVGVCFSVQGMPSFSLGAFAGPMTREFGWSQAAFQSVLLFLTGTLVLLAPFVGVACDRYGARRVALVAVVAYSGAFALLGATGASPWSFYAGAVLLGICGAGTLPIVWTRAVNSLFTRSRGFALGIALTGSAAFAALGPSYVTALIERFGWRWAWVGLGALPLLIALPVLLAWFRDPPRATAASGAVLPGLTLREALASWRFWVIVAAFALVTAGVGGLNTNLIPLFATKGIGAAEAAGIVGAFGASIAVGRLAMGWVIDRVWAPGVAAVVLSIPAVGCLMLGAENLDVRTAVVALVLVGLAAGAEFDFAAFLTARYFGLRHYGRIYGLVIGPMSLAVAVAAPLVALARDRTGSFDAALPWLAGAFVAGGASLLSLGRYPRFEAASAATGPAADQPAVSPPSTGITAPLT
jgi:MFS family permease